MSFLSRLDDAKTVSYKEITPTKNKFNVTETNETKLSSKQDSVDKVNCRQSLCNDLHSDYKSEDKNSSFSLTKDRIEQQNRELMNSQIQAAPLTTTIDYKQNMNSNSSRDNSVSSRIENWGSDDSDDEGGGKRSSIIWKVSEYLFDLFDANLMDGYKKIAAFEEKAVVHFMSNTRIEINTTCEFTIEQEMLHREFLDLFESLIEDYLSKEGYKISQFYTEVQKYQLMKESNTLKGEANEIIDIIGYYCDFTKWSSIMIDMAERKKKYKVCQPNNQSSIQNAIFAKKS
jgi:hypothetical protein